jgi:uncharacterized membrane protein YcaP (DUF421 family)
MNDLLSNLFSMDISWLEKIIRTIAVYAALLILLRLAGKRELSQLSTAELIVILLLSNTVQNAIIGDESSLIGGLVGAVILITMNKGLVHLTYRSSRAATLAQGQPVDLIRNGEPIMQTLHDQRITIAELESVCREHGVGEIRQVQRAVLETNGGISVIAAETGNDAALAERLANLEAALESLSKRLEPATR